MAGQLRASRALAGRCGVLVAVVLLFSLGAAFAAPPLVVHYDFPSPQVVANPDHTSRVEMGDLPRWGRPGAPSLPYRGCSLLLPPDTVVTDVAVTESAWETVPGSYVIEAAQRPVALSHRGPVSVTPPDPAIYSSDRPFPARSYDDYMIQRWRGHSLLMVNLRPVRYLPARGQVQACRRLSVTVSLAPAESPARLSTSMAPADLARLRRQIDNPEALWDYAAGGPVHGPLLNPTPAYDYVIIADASLDTSGTNSLQAFAAAKQAAGTTTTIVHTDWIYANYGGTRPDGGADNQTRLRNFIVDAYNTWGTHYVLLVGDADPVDVGGESGDLLIPHRGFYLDAGGEIDADLPSDLYYGCLDGTFDNNANGRYGEATDGPGGGEVDLLADVHVGRLCADSLTEVSNFVAKQLAYAGASPPRAVLMLGEYLGFGGVGDWGGNYKDEIKDGSSNHGYTTVGFLNSTSATMYDVSTLYDRDYPGNDWPKSELITGINTGLHVINHLGHANTIYGMKLGNSDVDALTNTAYFVSYSQGCYSGAFDNRDTSPGSYFSSDSISEHLNVGAHGSVATIANSRYGWGTSNSTDGPSQHFDREFWDALLGEGVREIGAANDDSKWDQASYVHLDPWGRWCCYETNLFGDPQLMVKVGVSSHGVVEFDQPVYGTSDTAGIVVLDTDLDLNPSAPDTVNVPVHSTTEVTPETVVCTETGASTGVFTGSISLAVGAPASDGVLQVAHGDVITVAYVDADDGSGGANVPRSDTAAVDGQAPTFAGLSHAAGGDSSVNLSWSAAADASPPIRYRIYRAGAPGGQNFSSPLASTEDLSYQDTAAVNGQTYWYVVRAQDVVGNEETNVVEHSATPRAAELIYQFPLDSDPGWTRQGGWQFGPPTGGGSGGGDPTSGHTGTNVYGYNLAGDYPDYMSAEYLISPALDCSALGSVSLRFWRWLGVESAAYDHAAVEVSLDGSNWSTVWEHGGGSFSDGAWLKCTYDISVVAAGQPTVYLRWRMGPTDGSVTYCGWNLDDIEIWGVTDVTSAGAVSLDRASYPPNGTVSVTVRDQDLDLNPTALDTVTVQAASSTEMIPESVLCTETDVATGIFVGHVDLATGSPQADGLLQVAHGDTIIVTYVDADDGSGGTNVPRTAMAAVDGQPPTFAGLVSAVPGDGRVTLSWSAASDPSLPLQYHVYRSETPGGQDFGSPLASTGGTSYVDDAVVNDTTYYYVVRAQDAAGNEDANTAQRSAQPTGPSLVYSFPLDTDPGWTCQGGWQFGHPTGGGSFAGDPTSGRTGANVYGYNLNGDYPNNMGTEYLTTAAIDCSALGSVQLRFWRWLGVESAMFDHAGVEVSADGTTWITVWEHEGDSLDDGAWMASAYDISAVAAGQSTVHLRWRMGPTDSSVTYCGWNLDDLEIWGSSDVTSSGAVGLNRGAYRPNALAQVTVRDRDLDANPSAPDSVSLEAHSSTETAPVTVVCTETGASTGIFQGDLQLAPGMAQADSLLQAVHGDTITVTYLDADDGGGGVNVPRTATATVDAQDPAFAGLSQAEAYPCCTLLTWSPAADASTPVRYRIYRSQTPGGQDFGSPFAGTGDTNYGDLSVIGQTYYYVVRAEDAAGNEDANRVERRAVCGLVYSVPLDTSPGWAGQGRWQFGRPTGGGSFAGDPTSGYTGLNVFGYNLAGDYANNLSTTEYLTTTPFDCSSLTAVALGFQRWLGVEDSAYDYASVEMSLDGVNWLTVWEHFGYALDDGSWVECGYDVSMVAAGQPSVRFRWGMGPTDSSVTFCGWNIDDIQIWGSLAEGCLFPDVPLTHWAYNEIGACYAARLVNGYPDGQYRPTQIVTRDQMAVYIARSLAGGDALVPPGPPTATFPDVPNTGYGPSGTDPYWAYKHIEYLAAQHIVSGYPNGAYGPTVMLDRGQMAGFIARALAPFSERPDLPGYTPPPPTFPDVLSGHWAYKYVEYVRAAGVVGGYPDGYYHPEVTCARDQMAVFVARAFGLLRTAEVQARIEGPADGNAAAEMRLDFYSPSDPVTPLYTRTVSLDGNGQAAPSLHLLYGTYNVRAKVPTHLARRLTGWSYASGAPAVLNFGTLLAGDVADDNVVDEADVASLWLRWLTNDARADINRDGVVNSLDLDLLNANFGLAGDP